MKSYLHLIIIFLLPVLCLAQNDSNIEQPVSINASGADPDTSAMLDVVSSTRGVLVPRMSSAARLAITLPAQGLIVYDTTLNALCHYTGSVWRCPVPDCETLDEAYDCGGPAMGNTIFVDTGAVTLFGSATTTSTLVVAAGSDVTAVSMTQADDGEVLTLNQTNMAATTDALTVTHDGMGRAGQFNTSNMMAPLPTLEVNQLGLGNTALFISHNMMNPMAAVDVQQLGPGIAGKFEGLEPTDMMPTVDAKEHGMSHAGYFESTNPATTMATVQAENLGMGDGVHGIATDSNFLQSGVTGTGRYTAAGAAAINAHDGAIRVSKTVSPNTPAEKVPLQLVSWLPMDDCAGCTGGPGGDTHAWNSDVITIPNIYCDPARSVIMHSVECAIPNIGIKAITKGIAPGTFGVQFVVDVDLCSGVVGCPPGPIPVILHYVIINQ